MKKKLTSELHKSTSTKSSKVDKPQGNSVLERWSCIEAVQLQTQSIRLCVLAGKFYCTGKQARLRSRTSVNLTSRNGHDTQ